MTRSHVVAMAFCAMCLWGCSTPDKRDSPPQTATLWLGGTFNVPGGVTYSRKSDSTSCAHLTTLAENLKAVGENLQDKTTTVTANEPIVVELYYEQMNPKASCRVIIEFTPEAGFTYLLFLNQVPILFGARCEPLLKRYLPLEKRSFDEPFRKVCAALS